MSILNDLRHLSQDELEELYSVEIQEDGSIWDPIEQVRYSDLVSWANSMEDDSGDVSGGFNKISHRHRFSDYD